MGVAGIPSRLTAALARYSDLSAPLPRYRGFYFRHCYFIATQSNPCGQTAA